MMLHRLISILAVLPAIAFGLAAQSSPLLAV